MGARDDLYARTWTYLQESFPAEATKRDDGQEFFVERGYLIALTPEVFPEDRALLTFYSIVSDPDGGLAETAELLAWVNETNQNLWLGALYFEQGKFVYAYSVPGEGVNQASLQLLVRGFASFSAKFANEVRAKFE